MKAARQRWRPVWKGTIMPRPQEKKKWASARTSSRRSMAFAARTMKLFKPHIAFMRAEQELDGPAVRIVYQDCLIRQGGIGTQE